MQLVVKYVLVAVIVAIVVAAGAAAYVITLPQPGKRIRFMHNEADPKTQEVFRVLIRDFETQNPNIYVEQEFVASHSAEWVKISSGVRSGGPPDIMWTIPEFALSLYNEGAAVQMDDVVDAIGKDDFAAAMLDLHKTPDGHYAGIPADANMYMLYIRTDLLERKGLKEPQTWDEMIAVAKALTEDTDGDGKIDQWGIALPLTRGGQASEWLIAFMWENGWNLYDENGKIQFDSPKTIEALEFYKELTKYSPPGYENWGYAEVGAAYGSGVIAMTYFYGRVTSYIERGKPDIGFVTKAIPPPVAPGGKPYGWMYPDTLVIASASKAIPEAKRFVQFLMEPKNNVQILTTVPIHFVPSLKSVLNDPTFLSDPLVSKYKSILDAEVQYANVWGRHMLREYEGTINPKVGEVYGSMIISDALQRYIIQGQSAQEVVSWAQGELEKIVPP